MSEQSESTVPGSTLPIPHGVEIALWLNALIQGHITHRDAAYALTDLSGAAGIWTDQSTTTTFMPWKEWLESDAVVHALVAIPVHGHPAGVTQAVIARMQTDSAVIALSRDELIFTDSELQWRVSNQPNLIAPLSISEARRMFLTEMAHAESTLTQLHSVGDAETAEHILRAKKMLHLPRQTDPRIEQAIEQAATVRALTQFGLARSLVFSSRSGDNQRVEILRALDLAARQYICAAASSLM